MYAIRSYYVQHLRGLPVDELPENQAKDHNESRDEYGDCKQNPEPPVNFHSCGSLLSMLSRRTSYNVCYTKLVRKCFIQSAAQNIVMQEEKRWEIYYQLKFQFTY